MRHSKIKWFSVIRVLGLFLVLAYHFFQDLLPGGFFGVDIFFTFSGYLITALAIEEFHKNGSFGLFSFYKRRFLRIFPPLALAIALTLPLALLISPDFVVGIGKQIAAALGFVSNYAEILNGGSYEAKMLPHLFVHTWSLSVEAHFYIVWGIICAVSAFIIAKKFPEKQKTRYLTLRLVIFAVAAAAAVFSYLYMRRSYLPGSDSSAIYFSSISHIFPFFIGAAAAAICGMDIKESQNSPRTGVVIFSIALSVIATICILVLARTMSFEDGRVYEFGFLCVSLLTAALIFCARAIHASTSEDTLEPLALSVIADLSYNIYLFHWPIYIVFETLFTNRIIAAIISLALSLLFSAIVFYGVEPLLRKSKQRFTKRFYALVSLLVLSALSLCAVVIARSPIITSMEKDIQAGYIMQDMDEIKALKRWTEAINDKPVLYNSSLKSGLLPAAVAVPPPVSIPSASADALGGVTIIGDSVTLGAQATLTGSISNCYVDAKVSRFLSGGFDVMMTLQGRGALRKYVVISLGTNPSNNYAADLKKIINSLESGHKLIVVTPYDGRTPDSGWAYQTAVYMRGLPSEYPYITVADWNATIRTQPELLSSDRFHLGTQSAQNLFASCVANAVNAALNKPEKP